jgi:hypothetical protein
MQINQDLNSVEEQEGFDLLPPGEYGITVVDSEVKQGAKGQYIQWIFKVDDKPNKIWDIMSLSNEISLKRLKTLAVVCGHPNPQYIHDTEELHGLKCNVQIKIKKDETGLYPDKNVISSFKKKKNKEVPTVQKTEETTMPWGEKRDIPF